MPFYRISRVDADVRIGDIEANGEEVVAVSIEGDQYAVFTRRIGAVVADVDGVAFRRIDRVDIGGVVEVVADTPIPVTRL